MSEDSYRNDFPDSEGDSPIFPAGISGQSPSYSPTSPEPAIRIHDLGKMFRLYPSPLAKVVDTLGLGRLLFWRRGRFREFWALRDVSLTLRKGERVGIIGRNGAGKSTLLKIICGNLQPSEGLCQVRGRVQALLDMGTGFHPEFTGRQNIRAALAYQDLDAGRIRELEEEIVELTELEEFINQPVKTYSLGMYSRLAFAVATSVRPELLIIDEVLGAGDAYFATKCAAKMKELVEDNGATVLLASHATDQILRYCERCLWLERGQIAKEGRSQEVVNAYLEFVHELEDRRLRAKNLRQNLEIRKDRAGAAQPSLKAAGRWQWVEQQTGLSGLRAETGVAAARTEDHRGGNGPAAECTTKKEPLSISRWPGDGSLMIEKVTLLGSEEREQALFAVGSRLSLRMTIKARRAGTYELLPTATLYRLDGIYISNFIGVAEHLELREDEEVGFQLDLGPLMLGNGEYVFSVAVFEGIVAGETRYDLLAKCYEFEVVGNDVLHADFIFAHPSSWSRLTTAQT
jgi:ABC-type polysaccharide/polyol phosphate transport system ATPase subunit